MATHPIATNVLGTKIDIKVGEFNGSEQAWPLWCLRMEAYTGMLGWSRIMDEAHRNPSVVVNSSLSENVQQVSAQLWNLLVSKCNGRAINITKLVGKQQGL